MVVPDFVKTILRSAAPTLLTALGLPPPFSIIAASVVSSVLAKYLPEALPTPNNDAKVPPLTPAQVSDVVQMNADNPQLILDLRQAEADLRKYELDAGIRFAEVEVRDRTRAGEFQSTSGLAEKSFFAGMILVGFAIISLGLLIAGTIYIVLYGIAIPKERTDVSTAAFGLIGTAVGFINGIAATIIAFYYGSSQSSKDKSDVIAANVRDLGHELGRAAARGSVIVPQAPAPSQNIPPALTVTGGSTRDSEPAQPASPSVLNEVLAELTVTHCHFPDSVTWALGKAGIAIDGAPAQGTPGDPVTIRKIWTNYGEFCATSARAYGVPVELIVATIAAESSGNPYARRMERRIGDESVGLMQTLVGTARGALGRQDLSADSLLDPAISVKAGTAYIAQQRGQTHFDPPRVAAAYNAGSLRLDGGANRWKMLCFPKGTGQHIDRWVAWFNDCMKVSAADGWGALGTPSFAASLSGEAGSVRSSPAFSATVPAGAAAASADLPPRPNLYPLRDTAARQALFGRFAYVADPEPSNRENIRITDDWATRNIIGVQVTEGPVGNVQGPLTIKFHRRGADQLKGLWAEWEEAGLLDRILTFDGGFVPRFIRGSTTSLSCHAFGCAFDINASYNSLGTPPPPVGRKGSVRELVGIANRHGFFWGGHFRTRTDGMHFEIARLVP